MDKTFNDFFDDFLGGEKPKKRVRKGGRKKHTELPKESNDSLSSEVKRILDSIKTFNPTMPFFEDGEDMVKGLGKPDETQFYDENGLFYEKRVWHTPNGDIVKIMVSDDPSMFIPPAPQKTLQEQLDEAVLNEEFEEAAKIRDMILKKDKLRKK